MNQRLGKYVTQNVVGESYSAYIPPKLPPSPPLDLARLAPLVEEAVAVLAQLNGMYKIMPNSSLFRYMDVHKEALLSSQIEGTQSSFADLMLFENNLEPKVSHDDVEEVSNYVKAITYGLERLKMGFLSL